MGSRFGVIVALSLAPTSRGNESHVVALSECRATCRWRRGADRAPRVNRRRYVPRSALTKQGGVFGWARFNRGLKAWRHAQYEAFNPCPYEGRDRGPCSLSRLAASERVLA